MEKKGVSDLIRYGTRETNKQPRAAHRMDKPVPLETSIPKGIFVVLRISPFTDSDVLMAEVQSEAPVKMNTVARIARHADAKKATVRLKTPLREESLATDKMGTGIRSKPTSRVLKTRK
jgi:hypothetical protein